MVRGLYTAYTGMRNEQRRLDIISNNLANSATIGYKEENVTSRSFKDMMAVKIRDGSVGYVDQNIGTMNLGVKIGETYMDWSQGNLRETGNTYDLAIQGDGFFTIRVTDKQGKDEMMYTRCSTFKCTQDGYIVDAEQSFGRAMVEIFRCPRMLMRSRSRRMARSMRTVSMSIRSHWLTLQIITILTYTEITSLGQWQEQRR